MAILICTEILALLLPVEVEDTTREGMSVASSFGLVFCGLIIAAYCAWTASNFAPRLLKDEHGAPQKLCSALKLAAPALVIGVSAYSLGYLTVMYRLRQVSALEPKMVVLAAVMLLGLTFGGLGVGLLLPRWIALPVGIVLFGGLQLAALVQKTPMVSNMAGLARCCSTDSTANPQVITAVGLCYLGWFAFGMMVLLFKSGSLQRCSPLVVAACSSLLVGGLWSAAVNGFEAGDQQAVDQTPNLQCVAGGAGAKHDYCFWPSETGQWEELGQNLVQGVQRLEDASGIELPRIITTSKGYAAATGGEYVKLDQQYTVESAMWDLAMRNVIDPDQQCMALLDQSAVYEDIVEEEYNPRVGHRERMLHQARLVHLWWASRADEGYLNLEDEAALEVLLGLPKTQQIDWVQRARAGVGECRLVALPASGQAS